MDIFNMTQEEDLLSGIKKQEEQPSMTPLSQDIPPQEMGNDELRSKWEQDNGIRTPSGDFTSRVSGWRATSKEASEMGIAEPQVKTVTEVIPAAFQSSASRVRELFAKTLGMEDIVKKEQELRSLNPNWELSREQTWSKNAAGWWMYQGVNAINTSAPTLAVGAAAAISGVGVVGAIGAAFATTYTQLLGDNYESVMQDTQGMIDPYSALGAAVAITGFQAGVEIGFGPQRMIISGLSKTAAKISSKQTLAKFVSREANQKAIQAFGRMLFEGKLTRIGASMSEEGMEEVLQLAGYDSTLAALTGRQFAAPSEYVNNFMAGAAGGGLMGIAGITLSHIADRDADVMLKNMAKDKTEDEVAQVYSRIVSPEERAAAIQKTEEAFAIMSENVPSSMKPIVPLVRNFAYGLSLQSQGRYMPEDTISILQAVFLNPEDSTKLQNAIWEKNADGSMKIDANGKPVQKGAEDTLTVLREINPRIDKYIRGLADRSAASSLKKVNDAVENDISTKYTKVTDDNRQNFNDYISAVFGKAISSAITENKQKGKVTSFSMYRGVVRNIMGESGANKDAMRSLFVNRAIDDVQIVDENGEINTVDLVFNDDFSVSVSQMSETTKKKRVKAAKLEEERKARAERISKIDKAGRIDQGVEGADEDYALEKGRQSDLAFKSALARDFDSRFDAFVRGEDLTEAELITTNEILEDSRLLLGEGSAVSYYPAIIPEEGETGIVAAGPVMDEQEIAKAFANPVKARLAFLLQEVTEENVAEIRELLQQLKSQQAALTGGAPETMVSGYPIGRLANEENGAEALLSMIDQKASLLKTQQSKFKFRASEMNNLKKAINDKLVAEKRSPVVFADVNQLKDYASELRAAITRQQAKNKDIKAGIADGVVLTPLEIDEAARAEVDELFERNDLARAMRLLDASGLGDITNSEQASIIKDRVKAGLLNYVKQKAQARAEESAALWREGKPSALNAQVQDHIFATYFPSQKLAVFYADATAETLLHEWFHHLHTSNLIPSNLEAALLKQFGSGGKWTNAGRENAANAFTLYIKNGRIPTGAQQDVVEAFEYAKRVISKTYEIVSGKEERVALNMATKDAKVKSRAAAITIAKNMADKIQKEAASLTDKEDFKGANDFTELKGMLGSPEILMQGWDDAVRLISLFRDKNGKPIIGPDSMASLKSAIDVLAEPTDTNQMELFNQADGKSRLRLSLSHEVVAEFDKLLVTVDDAALSGIYGKILAEDMQNSRVAEDGRINTQKAEEMLNQSAPKSDKASMQRRLFGFYKTKKAVKRAVGLSDSQSLKEATTEQIRKAVAELPVSNIMLKEFLASKGFSADTMEELYASNVEAGFAAERDLKDEQMKASAKYKRATVGEMREMGRETAKGILAKIKQLTSYAPSMLDGSQGSVFLQFLKNNAYKMLQAGIEWHYGLRDTCMFVDGYVDDVMQNGMTKNIWGRVLKANDNCAFERNKFDDVWEKELPTFEENIDRRVTMKSGATMRLQEIIALYCMAEGKTLSESDVYTEDEEKIKIEHRYKDVSAWLFSNTGASMELLNEAVNYINDNPALKTKVEHELDRMTELSNERFAAAVDVFESINGWKPEMLNKRWYTPMVRLGTSIEKTNIDGLFETFSGEKAGAQNIDSIRPFYTRTGENVGPISLDYRSNFHHHANTLINYQHKAMPVMESLAIMDNGIMRRVMEHRFGKDPTIFNNLKTLIKREMRVSGRWKNDKGLHDTAFGALTSNVYASLLSYNLGIGLMQFASLPIGLSEMDVTVKAFSQMVKNTGISLTNVLKNSYEAFKDGGFHGALKGVEVWEDMKAYAPSLTRRLSNPDLESQKRRLKEGYIGRMFPSIRKMIDRGNIIMEGGDQIVIMATWKTVFDIQVEKIGRENSSLRERAIKEIAGAKATEAVMSSQSPTLVAEKSLAQTGSSLEKAQFPFSGQAFTVLRGMVKNFVVPIATALQKSDSVGSAVVNVGKTIASKQVASKFLLAWVLPALMMGTVARRRPPKDEKEVVLDLLCYPFASVPFIGNMIWASVAMGWDRGGPISFYQDLAESITKTIKGGIQGEPDYNSFAKVAAMITGTPMAVNRIVKTAIEQYGSRDSSFDSDYALKYLGLKARD